jgi:hypothetical protein
MPSKYQTIDDINQRAPITVQLNGTSHFARDNGQKPIDCDLWRVTITGKDGFWSTDYRTGTGHRDKFGKPKKPKNADILHCLIMDASAAVMNFTQWCSEYGYSDDSLKALSMYKACCETGTALRKHIGRDDLDAIRELLQDY